MHAAVITLAAIGGTAVVVGLIWLVLFGMWKALTAGGRNPFM